MLRYLVFVILVISILAACSPATPTFPPLALETLQSENFALRRTGTAAAHVYASTLSALTSANEQATPTLKPSQLPTTTTSPTSSPETAELEIVSSTFIVDNELTIVLTLVRNNNRFAVQMAPYQIGLFNKEDVLVQAATGVIDLVLPQQQIMLSDVLLTPRKTQFAPKYHAIERIEVLISPGLPLDLDGQDLENALEVSQTDYLRDDYFPKVTGVITSKIGRELRAIPVVAAIYDEENTLIGGGMAYLPFLPPHASAPVEVSVVVSDYLSGRAELLPRLSLGSVMHVDQGAD